MKNSSVIIKLLSIVVSVILVVAFVLPKFEDIRTLQDDIALFQEHETNFDRINAHLQSLVTQVNNVSAANQTALANFLPDTIDTISILRTLHNIVGLSGAQTRSLEFSGSNTVEERNIEAHSFKFSISGSYETITNFLSLLEQNNYLLEISEAEFTIEEFDNLALSGELVAYSFLHDENLLSDSVR